MGKNDRMKNIFADKASLVLRKMLQNPERKWVVRDFTGHEGISLGMSQEVLKAMEKKGYIERVKKGPNSYTILANKKKLISNWLEEYSFDQNIMDTYYSANKNILNKFRKVLKENQYALTLHTGANLITSFVRTEEIFIYMNLKDWKKDILDIRQKLDLKELVRGGNIHLIHPFYKNSVFFNTQKIKGYTIVSNLQLYLDLYHFQPRGREQAEYLISLI
ncbi:hypothetical protein A2V47_08710 [Candidatus Atribacteria bacterium RBG_19FT_COMBO_35_14]|uniref:Uncharacterized protein n=1 Tax=Candidatus Sediminicultor quintus TaxID=1797291 RepID=A0A1F5A9A9_9BACT|nr:MAG: hypothetical protein A2V47_08710 [Candidatus Atribacteria bacterium RBG_19FT_COMBO_35_14]